MGLRTFLGLRKPGGAKAAVLAAEARAAAIVVPPDLDSWFSGKEFSQDWLSSKIVHWFAALEAQRELPAEILEVGSFEGRSAIAFLSYLPRSHITCVDTFALEDVTQKMDGNLIEQRFDRNLAPFGERVTKIKGNASTALDGLRTDAKTYDIVYLDAGKKRDWIFVLSALAWPLLRVGGVMIWDDLKWGRGKPDADRPESAIRLFCSAFSSCLDVVYEDRQMIVRKTSDWPAGQQG